MFSSPATSGRLTSYAHCNDSPSQSPDREPNMKNLPLPPVNRTISQCSSLSCSSTSELVDHQDNLQTSFIMRMFTWGRKKEKLRDAEKPPSSEVQSQEDSPDHRPPTLRAWHGWRLVFFGSCKISLSLTNFDTLIAAQGGTS